MTISANDRLHTLRQTLHDQLERHTDELTKLTAHTTDPARGGLDPQTVAALTESTRQAVADITQALRRVAEGTYGRCERCRADIPHERLEILPHARFCVPCQHARHRS
jgi:RNA polymerase-binding transcription factor DksA